MNQFPQTMLVHTSNGVENRVVDHLQCAATSRRKGIHATGLTAVPKLREGEEIKWTTNGECHIIQHPVGRFVTSIRYEYEFEQIKRIVEYSDGDTFERYVTRMPTPAEFELEKAEHNVYG